MRNAFFFLVLITLTLSCASLQQQPIPIEVSPSIVIHSPKPGQETDFGSMTVTWEVLDAGDARVQLALIEIDGRFVQGHGPDDFDERILNSHPTVYFPNEHRLTIYAALSDGRLLEATVPFRTAAPQRSAQDVESIMESNVQVVVPPNAHTLGDAGAPITVVVFEELLCPFCARHHNDLLELQKQYGRDKIRLVSMSFVVHREKAEYWQRVLYAFGRQGLYWEFLDVYYQKQREWRNVDQNDAWEKVITPFAREHNVNTAKLKIDIEDEEIAAQIEEEGNIARNLRVRGIPATYINGHMIRGARGLEIMKQVVDRLLASPE